jgi:predicted RNA-binding Zn-ribbon protein involved in translation (DUF1610 family)
MDNLKETNSGLKFVCPVDGEIPQDDVIFLCNVCKQEDMVYKNGTYMCPGCFKPGDNFECYKCGSKKVEMKEEKKK